MITLQNETTHSQKSNWEYLKAKKAQNKTQNTPVNHYGYGLCVACDAFDLSCEQTKQQSKIEIDPPQDKLSSRIKMKESVVRINTSCSYYARDTTKEISLHLCRCGTYRDVRTIVPAHWGSSTLAEEATDHNNLR